jgi:fibrillarin-like pre-rRNA processing protein
MMQKRYNNRGNDRREGFRKPQGFSKSEPRQFSASSNTSIQESRLKGVYDQQTYKGRKIFTLSINPGKKVYDEILVRHGNQEYREWNPKKSKLGAGIMKGISQIGIMPGKTVLYLGCSTGTTCSHVSDLIGNEGFLFGLDVAPRVMREFVFLCQDRQNMAPIMADANHPELYKDIVPEVDVVFQDIAQRNQVEIFLKNCDSYLKTQGFGLLALKARSVDVTQNPKLIFEKVKQELQSKMILVDYRELSPFEKDHCLFVVKKR